MTATEYVILVDEHDNQIGVAEKMNAHANNLLHRAFSIFIFRENNGLDVLLQQRALHKYHSPGLWSNACCSHPRPGEDIFKAGQRRLQEELNLQIPLKYQGKFKYNAHFSNGLAEHELDYVMVGYVSESDVMPLFNPDEIIACRWVRILDLQQELEQSPDQFTPWLKQALQIAVNES